MVTQIRMKLRQTNPRENVEDPFFAVKEVPLIRTDGVETDLRALVHGVTDKTMGTVSKRYNVTTHSQASLLVKDFLDKAGLKYQSLGPKTSTAGSRFFETLTFPDFIYNPLRDGASTALDAKGLMHDDLIPTITIRNSYDKTSPVAWDYGMFRLKCTNGMSILEEMTKLSFKHTQIIDADRVRDSLLANLENSTMLVSNIMNRLNASDGNEFLIKLLQAGFSDGFKEKIITNIAPFAQISYKDDIMDGRITRSIDSIKTKESAYAIYNVATAIATHDIGNRSLQDTVGRKIAKVFQIKAA